MNQPLHTSMNLPNPLSKTTPIMMPAFRKYADCRIQLPFLPFQLSWMFLASEDGLRCPPVSPFLLQSSLNAVGMLSVLSPGRVLPQVITAISASLENPALRHVTLEEYAIMQTAEGELYDKSILHRWEVTPEHFSGKRSCNSRWLPSFNIFLGS